MSSALARNAYADDADELVRLIAGEIPDDSDEALQPERQDVGWRWRFVGVLIALCSFSIAVLTIR